MRQRPRFTVVLLAGIAALGVVAAIAWGAADAYIDAFVYPGGPCSDAEARLTDQLTADPMLATSFPGSKIDRSESFQPCKGWGSNYWGGAFVTRSYTVVPLAATDIATFYSRLGEANGWRMATDRDTRDPCGKKEYGDRLVTFILTFPDSPGATSAVYTTTLLYAGQRQPVNECVE